MIICSIVRVVMKWNEMLTDADLLKLNVEDFEKHIIISALKRTHGNQTKAAKQLGTTKRIISYRVNKYNIDIEHFRIKKNEYAT